MPLSFLIGVAQNPTTHLHRTRDTPSSSLSSWLGQPTWSSSGCRACATGTLVGPVGVKARSPLPRRRRRPVYGQRFGRVWSATCLTPRQRCSSSRCPAVPRTRPAPGPPRMAGRSPCRSPSPGSPRPHHPAGHPHRPRRRPVRPGLTVEPAVIRFRPHPVNPQWDEAASAKSQQPVQTDQMPLLSSRRQKLPGAVQPTSTGAISLCAGIGRPREHTWHACP